MQNRFTNPADATFYDWAKNHDTEEASGKRRNIQHTAPTSGVGLVRQQGADDPYTLKLAGTITTRAQHREMWRWFRLSRTQTVYFRDFDNQEYEVQILDFEEQRHRRLPMGGNDPQQHYWTYTLEMEVLVFRSGDLKDMAVTP